MPTDPYAAALLLLKDRELTDDILNEIMERLPLVMSAVDPDFKFDSNASDAIRKQLEADIGIRVTAGDVLRSEEQVAWLDDARASIKWTYWNAYKRELEANRMNTTVIRTLNDDTDNVLNEMGNPSEPNGWRIQGLVMGDVQSGKTANYCGLINKAADAGYKVIVLLTGMIEDLRTQTQERIDTGFVGRDSRAIFENSRDNTPIGVGLRGRSVIPNVLTSIDYDFLSTNKRIMGGIPLENYIQNAPVIFVIKKNRSPLQNLLSFFDSQMSKGNKQLDLPFLLIDDEADNASVNAKKDEDPATINKLIRELLERFRRASYVAYTATPFANVFINPDLDDLFPKNFVYCLNTPTNYIGAAAIFSEGGAHSGQLVELSDAAAVFPEGHKKDQLVSILPESLCEALEAFVLSCAIRDLRQENLRHRSMLVNVSRFTAVQGRVARLLKDELFTLTEEIKQYLAADGSWHKHARLQRLHQTWRTHYSDCGVAWDDVRGILYDSIASVKVLTINQATDIADRLDYGAYRKSEKGRRVVAVGGLTLSRGLTLEGLSVSYFFRNSKAYDTLLQMGRWFGYRSGYEDLCRIWMDAAATDSYTHLAKVLAELRADFRRMFVSNQPPRKFGIRVQSHPESLIVTALNKMRNSQEVEVAVSYSQVGVETPYLPRSNDMNQRNREAVSKLVEKLANNNKTMYGNRHCWQKVPAATIAAFLFELEISNLNMPFVPDISGRERPLLTFIAQNNIAGLETWDVCIPQGDGAEYPGLAPLDGAGRPQPVCPRTRQFEVVKKSADYLKLNKQRVGDISDEKYDLDADELQAAEEAWKVEKAKDPTKGDTIPGYIYRAFRKRPTLTISLIAPKDAGPTAKNVKKIMAADELNEGPYVAISISFNAFDDSDEKKYVSYKLNKVALRTMGITEEDDDADED